VKIARLLTRGGSLTAARDAVIFICGKAIINFVHAIDSNLCLSSSPMALETVFLRKPQSLDGFAVICVVFAEFIWLAHHFRICGVSVLNIAGSPYSTLRSVAYGAHGLGGYDLRCSICASCEF
jgi:hypothetical protein